MSTFNTNSSYSRTYEKKVIEETPRTRISTSPFAAALPTGIPEHIFPPSFSALPSGVPSGFGSYHSIRTTDDSIQVSMELKDYTAENIKVSVVGDFIVVSAHHGEKKDDLGTIERQFTRRIPLPKGVQPESVTSTLSSDGILAIIALPPKPKESSPARAVPIKVEISKAT